ncbi:hypothetical protein ACA910_005343 [Epithemia clementina (nom. ined.)]
MSNPGNGGSVNIEVNTDYQGAIRFPAWFCLAVFSGVCLVAATTELDIKNRGSEERWTMTVSAISLAVSIVSVLAYLFMRGLFLSTPMAEGIMTLILLVFWGIGLPVIMAPDNGIAVSGNDVVNANLYFFSWVSFAISILLTLSLLQETMGIDARQADGKQTRWFFLCASSLIVLGSSTRIFNADSNACDEDGSTQFCKRSKFAISVGTISFVAALAMVMAIFKHLSAAIIELGVSSFLILLWTFGVGFITFGGDKSPGTTIGNLYFSTWISFILTVFLFGKSFQEFMGMQSTANNNTSTEQSPDQSENHHDSSGGGPPALPNEEDF